MQTKTTRVTLNINSSQTSNTKATHNDLRLDALFHAQIHVYPFSLPLSLTFIVDGSVDSKRAMGLLETLAVAIIRLDVILNIIGLVCVILRVYSSFWNVLCFGWNSNKMGKQSAFENPMKLESNGD